VGVAKDDARGVVVDEVGCGFESDGVESDPVSRQELI